MFVGNCPNCSSDVLIEMGETRCPFCPQTGVWKLNYGNLSVWMCFIWNAPKVPEIDYGDPEPPNQDQEQPESEFVNQVGGNIYD